MMGAIRPGHLPANRASCNGHSCLQLPVKHIARVVCKGVARMRVGVYAVVVCAALCIAELDTKMNSATSAVKVGGVGA
jgi:hypothetical protein